MKSFSVGFFLAFLPFVFSLGIATQSQAAITDFGTWTLVEDPAHVGFSASRTATSATLSAGNTVIPAGTDIGFQSVNGSTVASSTEGFRFSVESDFFIAIDYSWSFPGAANGFLGLGFGIGEDAGGSNSAGVAMGTSSGTPFLSFGGAARVNDVDQDPLPLGNPFLDTSSLQGTLFIDYVAASGDVTVGAAKSQGAAAPTLSETFAGIQNQWSDQDLIASFFIRSDDPPLTNAWSGGTADATFSNFRVLSGSAVAIPEPSFASLLLTCVIPATLRRRRR